MIQRIQTVYLFLAAVFMALGCYFPLMSFTSIANAEAKYNMTAYLLSPENTSWVFGLPHVTYGIIVCGVFSVILSFLNIFIYRNRKKQIKFCNFTMLFIILYYIAIGGYSYYLTCNLKEFQIMPTPWIILGILSFILIIMSKRGIKKDEELVRSASRIR